MRISSVSFKSTYIINSNNNRHDITDKLVNLHQTKNVNIHFQHVLPQDYFKFGIVVDDKDNKKIEKYLNKNCITYIKKSHSELLNEKSIRERLLVPINNGIFMDHLPKHFEIDTKNLESVYKKISKNKDIRYDYKECLDRIKSGLSVNIPKINIINCNGKPIIHFESGRNNYVVMRDLGFKTIPVIMNMHSFAAAYETGLIKGNS